MSPRKAVKKVEDESGLEDFEFELTKTTTQVATVSLKGKDSQDAILRLEKRLNEGDEFESADWSAGELDGPIDWEANFDEDEEDEEDAEEDDPELDADDDEA